MIGTFSSAYYGLAPAYRQAGAGEAGIILKVSFGQDVNALIK